MSILQDLAPSGPANNAAAPLPNTAPAAPPAGPSTPPSPEKGPSGGAAALKQAMPDLPDEVAALPVVQWIAVGQPPAVKFPAGHFYPELKPIEKNFASLVQSGIAYFQAADGGNVLYNPVFISQAELQAADQKGVLDEVIPDYSRLSDTKPQAMTDEDALESVQNQENAQRGLANIGLGPLDAPQGGPASVPVGAMPPPAPAASQNRLNTARLASLAPGSPTSGPAPGGGRILNDLLKPTI